MIQEEIKKGNINSRLDNCVSSLDIQAREDRKQQEIIRLMPEIKKRSALVSENESSFEAGIFCRGFVEGAEWRINSVWHDWEDGNNVPDFGELCLVEFETDVDSKYYQRLVHADKFKGHDVTGIPYFWNTPKKAHIIRWAYIDDLLSKKEE